MDHNLSREDAIKEIMAATGSDEVTANFIYGIETGEVTGDSLNQDGVDPDADMPWTVEGNPAPVAIAQNNEPPLTP